MKQKDIIAFRDQEIAGKINGLIEAAKAKGIKIGKSDIMRAAIDEAIAKLENGESVGMINLSKIFPKKSWKTFSEEPWKEKELPDEYAYGLIHPGELQPPTPSFPANPHDSHEPMKMNAPTPYLWRRMQHMQSKLRFFKTPEEIESDIESKAAKLRKASRKALGDFNDLP